MKHDARGSSNDLLRVIPDFHMGRTRQDMTHVFFAPRTRGSCWPEYIDAFQTFVTMYILEITYASWKIFHTTANSWFIGIFKTP